VVLPVEQDTKLLVCLGNDSRENQYNAAAANISQSKSSSPLLLRHKGLVLV
jgi:hypothetical protein